MICDERLGLSPTEMNLHKNRRYLRQGENLDHAVSVTNLEKASKRVHVS